MCFIAKKLTFKNLSFQSTILVTVLDFTCDNVQLHPGNQTHAQNDRQKQY